MTGRRRIQEVWVLCGLGLSLIHTGSAAADTKAFVGARIFDGTGKAVIEKGTIVVLDGRIAVVGPSDKVKAALSRNSTA
jgi:imidazolonepropionase-like amidohydrolase